MSAEELRLLTLIRPFLRLLPADKPLGMKDDLGQLGLDSMQTIDLLMALETEYGQQIPDQNLTVDSFSTPENVMKLLA